jgi:hypothetical protein
MANLGNKFLVMAVLAASTLFVGCGPTKHQALNPVEIFETSEGFSITEADAKIMSYQRKHKSINGKFLRANYIHPLYGLDGLGDKKLGDSWATQDFFWDVYDAKILNVDSQSRALQVYVNWKSPLWTDADGKKKPFLKETTTIRVHRTRNDIRKIDFEIKLLALADGMRLGGSEDVKGYGGFSTRIPLPNGLSFTGTGGPVEPKNLSVEAGPWLDFTGDFGKDGNRSGLTILCHNSSPGYPQRWILRRKGSAQNPVYPGRHPVGLSRDKPLVLRYRLIIHRSKLSREDLDKLQAEYNSELLPIFDDR